MRCCELAPRAACYDNIRFVSQRGLNVPRLLRWGATTNNGAPYVFEDPTDPGHTIGVEVDVAQAIARAMGIGQSRVETGYTHLDQALALGSLDVIINRWGIKEEHTRTELFSQPYYRVAQQIVVRTGDPRFAAMTIYDRLQLVHLEGLTVGARAGSHAAAILASDTSITRKIYDLDLPFDDLARGRIDAVLIDQPTAACYVEGTALGIAANPALRLIGRPFQQRAYVIAVSRTNPHATALQQEIDQALTRLKADGTLRQILTRWKLWNEQQADIGID